MEAESTNNKPSDNTASTSSNNNNIKENSSNNKKEKEHHRAMQENGHTKIGGKAQGEKKPIRLNSPAGAMPVSWHWSDKEENSIGIEVIEIIKFTCFHFPELGASSLKSKLENVDITNYDQVRSLAKKFNKVVKETAQNRKENSLWLKSRELFHQILTRCYNRAVDNEKALNKHYEAFSSQTYGETSFERMQMIIEELKPHSKDVFVDLGSGVGQLVVHVAGATQVQKAVGMEIAHLPSKFAKKLETEFRKWMNWFGRPFRPFELNQADFLGEENRKLITEEATIIFINNYAFQSDLETRIKRELLSDLKDGTRIISTKPYVPLNKQGAITDRQLNDISVICEATEMRPCPNPCSWTSAYVPYYLHTINRTKLEKYFLNLRNSSLRAKSSETGSRHSSTPNSKESNSRESSVGRMIRDKSSDNIRMGEDVWSVRYGPTTRRKWTEYVNELEMQKRKKKGKQTSSTSSSGNASTAASTPAPASGSSQLTNSSTTGSEMTAQIPSEVALIGCSSSRAKIGTVTMEQQEEENTPATANPTESGSSEQLPNSVIIPIPASTPPSYISSMQLMTSTTVTVPLESENNFREILSPKYEPISPAKPSNASKRGPAKRSYERKEKSSTSTGIGRGRPRKTDKLGLHTNPKAPRLSDDARDGMEMMHQMTCAVQSGKPMDTASILADMANQKQAGVRLFGADASSLMETSPPFPNLDNPPGPSTSSTLRHDFHGQQYASRYPGLNKFLDGFRNVYENFFDDIYANRQLPPSIKDEQLTVRVDTLTHRQNNGSPPMMDQFPGGYRTTLDRIQMKRPVDEMAEIDNGRLHQTETLGIIGGHGRMLELQKRIQERRQRLSSKLMEFQQEMTLLNGDMDALAAECRQQEDAQQHKAQQQQLQQEQLVQQQQQQQLIAAAQAQLAAAAAQAQAQQSAAAAAATAVQQAAQQAQATQQVNQASAAVSNQLELIINEMRERYSQQLTAQHLLQQISQYGLLNVIAPQEIAALQNIASGAALNLNGVHQMSPVAAAAAAAVLHSPVAQAAAMPRPGPSPAHHLQHQLGNGLTVQNFLSSLDTLNDGCGRRSSNGNATSGISANVSVVSAELAHTASSHGMNSAIAVQSSNQQGLGQPTSLSIHQVSQNFPCPSSSASSSIPVQLSRESTVAEIVAEVAALPSTIPRKPFRPRPVRTNGGSKRNGQNGQKQQQQTVEDPKKQEEIERQIQDIVAKALEVDSAAKSAEKDRKARGGEKRSSREKSGSGNGSSLIINSSSTPTTLAISMDSNHKLPPPMQPAARGGPSNIEFQVKAEKAIMQNLILSATQKQLAQQQCAAAADGEATIGINISPGTQLHQQLSSTPTSVLDGKSTPLNSLSFSSADLRAMAAAAASTTPKMQSPSLGIAQQQQQQHFTFTPSSVSLAIQGCGPPTTFSTPTSIIASGTPPNKMMTQPNASPSTAGFMHPSQSCSPPFISLNLPPNTCALGPPPTNVVVKIEQKESKMPASGLSGHPGLS